MAKKPKILIMNMGEDDKKIFLLKEVIWLERITETYPDLSHKLHENRENNNATD